MTNSVMPPILFDSLSNIQIHFVIADSRINHVYNIPNALLFFLIKNDILVDLEKQSHAK